MTRSHISLTIFLVAVGLAWSLFTLRVESLLLWLGMVALLLFKRFRQSNAGAPTVFLAIMLASFSPIGITFVNAPGPPRLVHCCPGMPLRYAEIKTEARAGKCAYCSDLVSGFEASRYVVW